MIFLKRSSYNLHVHVRINVANVGQRFEKRRHGRCSVFPMRDQKSNLNSFVDGQSSQLVIDFGPKPTSTSHKLIINLDTERGGYYWSFTGDAECRAWPEYNPWQQYLCTLRLDSSCWQSIVNHRYVRRRTIEAVSSIYRQDNCLFF